MGLHKIVFTGRKAGVLAQYFNSMRIDKECAEAIQTVKTSFVSKAIVERTVKEHGAERVGWVLAAAMQHDNSNSLSHHKN